MNCYLFPWRALFTTGLMAALLLLVLPARGQGSKKDDDLPPLPTKKSKDDDPPLPSNKVIATVKNGQVLPFMKKPAPRMGEFLGRGGRLVAESRCAELQMISALPLIPAKGQQRFVAQGPDFVVRPISELK